MHSALNSDLDKAIWIICTFSKNAYLVSTQCMTGPASACYLSLRRYYYSS